jgi:hypothetical protein
LMLALRSPDGIAKPCSSGAASLLSAFNLNFFIVVFQFLVLLLHCRLSISISSLSSFNLWCCFFIVGFHSSFSPHLLLQQFSVCSMFPLHCNFLFPVLMQQTAQRRTTVFPLFVFLELMLSLTAARVLRRMPAMFCMRQYGGRAFAQMREVPGSLKHGLGTEP